MGTCSGTPVLSVSVVYDFCQRRTTWSSMVTISDGSMKELEYTTNDCSGESEIRTIGSMTPCSASLYPKETGKFVTITLESEGSGGSDGADGSDKNTLVSGTSKVEMSCGLLAFLLVKMVV